MYAKNIYFKRMDEDVCLISLCVGISAVLL